MVGEFENLLEEIGVSLRPDPGDGVGPAMVLTATDGSLFKAVDGTPALLALRSRLRRNEKRMVRAVRQVVDIIKSQAAQIDELSGKPRRAASAHGTVTADEFFAKAMTAQADGRISAIEISRAEAALGSGLPVPVDIVRRVMA